MRTYFNIYQHEIFRSIKNKNNQTMEVMWEKFLDYFNFVKELPYVQHKIIDSLNLPIIEYSHYLRSFPTYFVESQELVQFLYDSNFHIDSEAINLPDKVVSITTPSITKIPGFLFCKFSSQELYQIYYKILSKINQNIPDYFEGPEDYKYYYYICFKEKNAYKNTDYWIHEQKAKEIISEKNAEGVRRLFQFALRTIIYCQAFPSCITKGLPNIIKQQQIKQVNTKNSITIKLNEHFANSNYSKSHFRRGHFRSLTHQKFKRDDNGNIKIIYVNPCIVNFLMPKETLTYTII